MTAWEPYATHIRLAKETKEVSFPFPADFTILNVVQKDGCEPLERSFRAILDANTGSGIKDVTGIGAHACARHGCYCPSSVVNFKLGEGQKHMDYSFSEAVKMCSCTGIQRILHIYDIACQYHKHLAKCFHENRAYLTMPSVILDRAIGMFHVHGHQDSCFYRYATSFVTGGGMVDGEIAETLWSVLNSISPSLRTATLAHRSEVLDDHMNDSNWKKIIGIRESGPTMILSSLTLD